MELEMSECAVVKRVKVIADREREVGLSMVLMRDFCFK